jgi:hypothetical protein
MNPEWLRWILPGDIIILGIFFVVLLFFYKNTGSRVMKEIEAKQTTEACLDIRSQCFSLRGEKATGLEKNIDLRFDQIVEKVDLILERQSQLIARIDRHINGEK